MKPFRLLISLLLTFVAMFCFTPAAWAFCGFYVAKADAKLYNKASQVAIARSGDRTVLTMANDFQGEVKDFAIVVPVPTVLQKEQVRVAQPKIIERLDAFSAPRLVEYFDSDPCAPVYENSSRLPVPLPAAPRNRVGSARSAENLGVTVEARFNVGEYDIVILSAKESGGLETWLNRNGYKIPRGAKQLLQPYIRSSMKFFVAKVNLDKFEESGYQFLRPLQISYSSPKFMLPIRLGMINATTEQDLIVYILSPKGQAEITNYRTVKVPSGDNIPLFVKDEFSDFYKSMFQTSYIKEDRKVAFLEYAWDMSNCDPCSAEPLSQQELKQAGVFWLDNDFGVNAPAPRRIRPPSPSSSVFISRLHVRYTRDKFPEDLMFQQTSNRESFQGRYVLQHPFTGEVTCSAGREYKRSLGKRFEKEAQTLAKLTNWNIQDIRQKMKLVGQVSSSWWQNLFSWLGLA
ncbi:DUF2330 domain-containing protein [Hassallia byssoidea VB512170]|uniref:DUF2330 domain-containing protein n=1 Tax=Hassallia byssoidea VB512170 TaxID=1304833 RepID=A0A846H6L4_9CYAN|nr:DUF2330 domain-containing protein [Hassalia byssoidea]NEU72240.1 DUF2330 domain-containing protein [Hassalia byssoidea VB512170]